MKTERARILVVDDDPQERGPVVLGLRDRGYRAEGAEDGLQALHHLQRGEFDVVVTDVQMPHLDGLALLREIRGKGYALAVVVRTTLYDCSLDAVFRRAGAFSVLAKGRPFEEIVRSVEAAFRFSRRLRTRGTNEMNGRGDQASKSLGNISAGDRESMRREQSSGELAASPIQILGPARMGPKREGG